MFFIIVREMSALFRPYGLRKSRSSVGCSVARANDANVSMIKFTHNICTAFRGLSFIIQAPRKATVTATTFTVSWNCRNFAILSYTFLPHMTAFTIEEKLSSVSMMSEASFATSVPAIPCLCVKITYVVNFHRNLCKCTKICVVNLEGK